MCECEVGWSGLACDETPCEDYNCSASGRCGGSNDGCGGSCYQECPQTTAVMINGRYDSPPLEDGRWSGVSSMYFRVHQGDNWSRSRQWCNKEWPTIVVDATEEGTGAIKQLTLKLYKYCPGCWSSARFHAGCNAGWGGAGNYHAYFVVDADLSPGLVEGKKYTSHGIELLGYAWHTHHAVLGANPVLGKWPIELEYTA